MKNSFTKKRISCLNRKKKGDQNTSGSHKAAVWAGKFCCVSPRRDYSVARCADGHTNFSGFAHFAHLDDLLNNEEQYICLANQHEKDAFRDWQMDIYPSIKGTWRFINHF